MLKIVADSAIPGVDELFHHHAVITKILGNEIRAEDVKNADILLVRTVTKVNAELLSNSAVKFVGTMTAGTDHLDTHWLDQQNIAWANAKGANARAVAEYVISCIAYLQQQNLLPTLFRAGIIGVGHVGNELLALLRILGINPLLNDPPRANSDQKFHSIDLSAFRNLDLISIHVPLVTEGPFPTHYLIPADFMQRQSNKILINTSRGEAVNPKGLAEINCLDVFENEPHIDFALFERSLIATTHIAGYSLQAKLRASLYVFNAIAHYFEWPLLENPEQILQESGKQKILDLPQVQNWQEAVLAAYDPYRESLHFKTDLLEHALDIATRYEYLRRNYQLRPEFNFFTLRTPRLSAPDKKILTSFGFNLIT